jgi:wyosine [tRNA(Phe)-imidazoG37] synthetase (radical SAM superfamily)
MDKSPLKPKYVFGPVPSRRLGRSLGVDLVPYKTCTFDCIYCDLGRTTQQTTLRQSFASLEEIQSELKSYLSVLDKKPDSITFSGSGEPTLSNHIGQIIRGAKEITSIPIAVITNSSLFSLEEVRRDLSEADVVLPSLDAMTPALFGYINRPHPSLTIEEVYKGLVQFRKEYRGQIWLEIVFCRGVNDHREEIERFKEAIGRIQPDRVQLNTPTRPPAEDFVFPLTKDQLEDIRKKLGEKAEVIPEFVAPLGDRFDSGRDTEIINLLKRRPCTAEDISRALGLRLEEVVKYLNHLRSKGAVQYRVFEHRCYYENALPH